MIMKLKGWQLMGLASIFSFFFGCDVDATNKDAKPVTNFNWYSVATALRDYPMEVIGGTFYYKDQNAGNNIPSGGTLTQGWGESSSVYVGGPGRPPLPDRVEIKFYSYAENKFYHA